MADQPSWWMRAQPAPESASQRLRRNASSPRWWARVPLADSFVAAFTKWVTATTSGYPRELGPPGAGSFWRRRAWYPIALLQMGRGVKRISSSSGLLMSSAASDFQESALVYSA